MSRQRMVRICIIFSLCVWLALAWLAFRFVTHP